MIRCKDCKNWDSSKVIPICQLGPVMGGDPTQMSGQEILAFTSSSHILIQNRPSLHFYTGANFGCVHGALKETKK